MDDAQSSHRTGLILGVLAYTCWGFLPLYIRLLRHVPALQVLAHRVLWSLLLLAVIVLALRRVRALQRAARGRTLLLLAASSTLIAGNWMTYIWAVQNDHVLEASLGYFMTPLVNVALGVGLLGERFRPLQGVAILVAALGVAVMALSGGDALWVSLVLAVSFGLYGLLRKIAEIDALSGLTVETIMLAPLSLIVVLYAGANGQGSFGHSLATDALLVCAGIVTATPLLLFAGAAKRLPLTTLGLLQYLGPSLSFLQAVLIFHEPVRPVHIITFALIWGGCALYTIDGLRARRTPEPALQPE